MSEHSKRASGITYREEPGKSVTVLMAGRVVGHIYSNRTGYIYAPKGSTLRGDTHPTVAAVKKSIEAA